MSVAPAQDQNQAQDMAAARAGELLPNAMWLEDLSLANMTSGYGKPRVGRDVDGDPITVQGVVYAHGVGTHAASQMVIDLKGVASRFVSLVGVDDETVGKGKVVFSVVVDGKKVAASGTIRGGDPPQLLAADLKGARRMILNVAGADGDISWGHADWAGAMIVLVPNATLRPESVDLNVEAPPIKMPPFFPAAPQPVIHGPRVVGASPRRDFLFLVPATGKAPLVYRAAGLPKGLNLDPKSGIISGRIEEAGSYKVRLEVSGPAGGTTRLLNIVCGERKLAQTPILGWSAWQVFGETVTADKVREQADWLIKSGLAARGFQYILLDDTWQSRRDPDGKIGPNRRFGDIKALADYLHSKGLKLGIHSSPNEETCSGFAGSAGHEAQDAALYASWGIDYLKYDWCQVGSTRQTVTDDVLKAAYAKMRAALDATDRDIVYAITPYGFGNATDWGRKSEVGANSWWTHAQIIDTWDSMARNGFEQAWRAYAAGPGHWNDPGWLMIGRFGAGSNSPHFSRLKGGEQMVQVSLWSLAAAPLIISCDLTQLNPNNFYPLTTALLTNDEILDVNQDPLGKAASRVAGSGSIEVWARPLSDGTQAVGLFNKGGQPQEINVDWKDLKISGSQPVRDLWQHKDLGDFDGSFSITVPRHGVVLLKVGKPAPVE